MSQEKHTALAARLKVNQVEAAELQSLLLDYYGRGWSNQDGKHHVGREDGVAALTLTFSRRGNISRIDQGPAFIDNEIDDISADIQAQLIDEGPQGIARTIMFAAAPLNGTYRYHQKFQLLPVPLEAPRPFYGYGGHPFQLEVSYTSSACRSVNITRLTKASREVELLCATLLSPGVYARTRNTNSHWVMTDASPGCAYLQDHYGFPGLSQCYDSFTSQNDIPPAKSAEAHVYYTTAGVHSNDDLILPDTLTLSLDKYFALPDNDRKRYLAACYWYHQATHLWGISQSSSYIALASAIEAMLIPASGESCTSCGKPTGLGPTALFDQFLEANVPDPFATRASRKAIYTARSKIVHGNKIMAFDQAEWMGGNSHLQDDVALRNFTKTVQIALINWLVKQP